eukprot:scaffold1289_cov274-Pinguiococcus_pyrenoidosus.AAC.2
MRRTTAAAAQLARAGGHGRSTYQSVRAYSAPGRRQPPHQLQRSRELKEGLEALKRERRAVVEHNLDGVPVEARQDEHAKQGQSQAAVAEESAGGRSPGPGERPGARQRGALRAGDWEKLGVERTTCAR